MRTYMAVVGVVLLHLWLNPTARSQNMPLGPLVTEAELKALIGNGVLMDLENANGLKGALLLLKGGGARMLYYHSFVGQGDSDKGNWRIQGDAICYTWTFIASAKKTCVRFHRRADGRFDAVPTPRSSVLTNVVWVRK